MISLVIPVYKNTELFLNNLRHNLPHVKNAEIIIVNDDPETDLTAPVKKVCPQALVINNSQNLGFGKSVNLGVKKATGEILFLLNSDVRLNDDKYLSALKEFADPQLFALSFAQLDNKGQLSVANQGSFKSGLFQHTTKEATDVVPTLWAEGGSALMRKKYFDKLGGFDPIYSPFYWEDVDLGYRAQAAGYKVLFYPKVVVIHDHATTINKYYQSETTRAINYRNQLLFTWKHSRCCQLALHLIMLPILLLKMRKDKAFGEGFKEALQVKFLNRA